jgi:hypothetical protein
LFAAHHFQISSLKIAKSVTFKGKQNRWQIFARCFMLVIQGGRNDVEITKGQGPRVGVASTERTGLPITLWFYMGARQGKIHALAMLDMGRDGH